MNDDDEKRESIAFRIEGFSSLRSLTLKANSTEVNFSIKNLESLKCLRLYTFKIDQDILTRLLDQLQHIQELVLDGNLSYINLDNLVNLKCLTLCGTLNESCFNFELFKNLSNQLERLTIVLTNIDEKTLSKLFDIHYFSNLNYFAIYKFNLKRLEKQFLNRFLFPMLRELSIGFCDLEEIEIDAFSNMQQLVCLNLSMNRIRFIEKNTFANLKKLETLDLSDNVLTTIDREFIGVRNSVETIPD